MHPENQFLYDWKAYFDLLNTENAFSEVEQILMIRLLLTTVTSCSQRAEATQHVKGGKRAAAKQDETHAKVLGALEAFTSEAVDVLPKLLTKLQVRSMTCDVVLWPLP
jgi:hypothetical protein